MALLKMITGCFLILTLSACAGTDAHLRLLEGANALRIEPAQGKNYDYIVRISNAAVDIGYYPDDKATRDDIAMRTIRAQCPAARIVGENIIEKGTSVLSRSLREYLIQIKCS